MSAPMVRAILAGSKTQTRRVVRGSDNWHPDTVAVKFLRHHSADGLAMPLDKFERVLGSAVRCPYGVPGDRLWVRETWGLAGHMKHDPGYVEYRADCKDGGKFNSVGDAVDFWRPSIFMPRSHCRIWLEVTEVRVERVTDISEADAIAEGIPAFITSPSTIPRQQYSTLWNSINGKGSWNKNPWVWAVTFKRI